ncbi:MAG: M16 family metallopeptidase [Desulfomonilaceae bacterium]
MTRKTQSLDSIFKKTVLDNGVRILTEDLPYLKSVSLCIWVLSGSRIEEEGQSGISHFLEHMLFKGTLNRDTLQIARAIDSVGGSFNACTSKESTSFYCRILSDDLPLGADVLTDMYLHSTFPDEEIEREKQVVCQEIRQLEDSPEDFVSELFNMRFWRDDSFGRPVIGSIDNIVNFDRETIIRYKTDNYGPHQTIVCAAGNLNHEDLVGLVKDGMDSLEDRAPQRLPQKPKTSPGCLIHERDLEQVHLCVGVEGPNIKDNDRNSAYLFSVLFGGGMSSRLFQEIREKRGLAYSVYSFYSTFSDTGMVGVYASTEPDRFEELVEVIADETHKVTNSITNEELQNAKNQLRGTIIIANESAESRISRIVKGEIYYGRYVSLEEIISDIQRITLGELQDFVARLFKPGKYTVTALGQIPASMDILGYFNQN